ncbi:MAG: alpha/beta hydrolase [Pelagibaca sp.]
MDRRFFVLAGAAAVSGCVERGRFSVASTTTAETGTQTLLVATSRAADPAPIAYGPGRSQSLGFARLAISIPPTHRIGQIEWPEGPNADPARHFALVGAEPLAGIEALVSATRQATSGQNEEAVLFVHGYNTNFAEGVYRHAQIAWDYGLRGPQIHFAWPSSADPLGYAYDRDSSLIARDALAGLLSRFLQERELRLSVVGHSMGAFLVMEALRQIAFKGGEARLDRLAGVTLVSPDIDIDLFRAQAEALEPLPQPFAIAVSRNDRLLRLSSRLARGETRLGSVDDLAQLEGLGITVIDLSGLGDTGSNHFLLGTSPSAIALIRGLRDTNSFPADNITLGPVRIVLGSAQ